LSTFYFIDVYILLLLPHPFLSHYDLLDPSRIFYLSISEILAYQQKGSILTCRSKLPPLLKYYNQILSVLTPISSILISALTNKHGAIGPHEFEIGLRKQVKDGIFFRARAALKVQQR
jgi:hypothetical protein